VVPGRIVGSFDVRQSGAKRLSLSHRVGIALVILGMMQSLSPAWFRTVRPALRVANPLKVTLTWLRIADLSTSPLLSSEAGQDPQEPDQESSNSEDFTESFTWTEAINVRRTVQRFVSFASLRLAPGSERTTGRTTSSLQQSRTHAILASSSADLIARLCRMTC